MDETDGIGRSKEELLRFALTRLDVLEHDMEVCKGQNAQLLRRVTTMENLLGNGPSELEKKLVDLTYRHEQLAMHQATRMEKIEERAAVTALELHHAREVLNKLVLTQEAGVQIDKGLQEAQSRAFWVAMDALSHVVELSNQVRALKGDIQK